MKISQKQILEATAEQLTLFQVASRNHANHTQAQENEKEKKMNATSGPKCLEQFERFDRVGSWAKTFSGLLIGMEGWYSRRCKLIWNLKGTKSNRLYFQLVPSMLPTEEIGFGLLPTPTTQEPTSDCEITETKRRKTKDGKGSHSLNLGRFVTMLPTPTTRDWKGTGQNERIRDGKIQKDTLDRVFEPGTTSQLNPRFVAEMMGFPPNWTELPFQSGETNQSKPTETQ